jgi:outer membrane receptor for ferrienterochelin and colicin
LLGREIKEVEMSRFLRAFTIGAVAVACLSTGIWAQSQATTGVIAGSVVDDDGAALPGVTVTLTNTGTNFEKVVVTDAGGRFTAVLLPLGPYTVTAGLEGFATLVREGIDLSLGESIFLEFTLSLSETREEITVTGEAPLIELTRTEGQTRIDDRSIEGLPNDGRNFLKFSELTPGVSIVQGPDGDELSISGQRGINNNVMVDGADFNNPFFGEHRGGQRPAFTFNQDAIKELLVVADGAPAEFGRSSGGFVSVVTKSGTNDWKGSAHFYSKTDSLAEDPQTRTGTEAREFDQFQTGFTLGGPIKKDKTFFFLSADVQKKDETKQFEADRMSADLVAFLNSVGIPDDNGPIERTDDADAYSGKIDWQQSDRNLFTLRYSYTYSQQINGTFDVDLWGRSMNGIETDYSHAGTGSVISTLSDSLLNEFRAQYAKEWRPRPYGGPINPETGRPFPDTRDVFTNEGWGMPFFLPIEYDDDRVQFNDNLSILKGDHSIKAGIEYNEVSSSQTFIGFASGRYVFGGFDEGRGPVFLYLQLVPVRGNTVESVGTQTITQKEPALFIQDQWRPTANLTIEYGVRWEEQDQPGPRTPPEEVFFAPFIGQTVTNETGTYEFPSDGNIPDDDSIQPRLGISWAPDDRSVVRFNSGYYMARLPALMLASTRSTNGSIGGNARPDQIPGLTEPVVWPNIIPPEFTSNLDFLFFPEIFIFDKDFELPKTASAAISYEREVAPNWAVLGKVNYANTSHLFRMFQSNDPIFGCPWSTGLEPNGTNGIDCTIPDFSAGLHTVMSNAKSKYWGTTVGINKRWSNNYQFQIYYTNSLDRSDDDNERDPFTYKYARGDRLDKEWSVSDRHQRHRINAWLSWEAPKGIDVNVRYTYRDAQPVSLTGTGEIAPSPGARNNPDGTIEQRNQGKKDNKLNVWDLRISKDFQVGNTTVQPILDVFNLADSANFLRPATTALAFNFDGTLRSGAGDPREIQLGVRVLW